MKIFSVFTSYAAVADALKEQEGWTLSGEAIRKWVLKGVPPERVIAVSRASGWKCTPHQLRPDIYPSPLDGLPDEVRHAA